MANHFKNRVSRRDFLKLAGGTLAAAGVGSIAAACGAPAPTAAPTEAPMAAPTATSAPAPKAGQELKMWWWGEQEAPGLEQWMAETIELFKEESGHNITATLQDTSTVISEFQTASAANNAPDIQFLWNGIYHMESVWLGYVEALNGLIPDDVLADSNATPLSVYQGKQYRVGWYAESPCWIYNKELFDQAGLNADEAPATWDDFLNACDKLKSKGITPLTAGLKDGPWGEWYMGYALAPNLDSPADALNLFIADLDWREPRYYDHWTKLAQLWEAGFFNDDMNSIDLYPGIDLFGAGKGAMTALVVPLIPAQAEMIGTEKAGLMVYPAGGVGKLNGKAIVDMSGMGISSESENKEAAAEFLEFMHTGDRVSALYKQVKALPGDFSWDGDAEIDDPLLKQAWKLFASNPDGMPYISNLMPTLFWTDAMFVNSQKIIAGEYTGEQAGENAQAVSEKWREQNPDLLEHYTIWAKDLAL